MSRPPLSRPGNAWQAQPTLSCDVVYKRSRGFPVAPVDRRSPGMKTTLAGAAALAMLLAIHAVPPAAEAQTAGPPPTGVGGGATGQGPGGFRPRATTPSVGTATSPRRAATRTTTRAERRSAAIASRQATRTRPTDPRDRAYQDGGTLGGVGSGGGLGSGPGGSRGGESPAPGTTGGGTSPNYGATVGGGAAGRAGSTAGSGPGTTGGAGSGNQPGTSGTSRN